MPEALTAEPFGVYVHWPFCASKCPYCDFNSHVRPGGVDQKAFATALCRELASLRDYSGHRSVSSIFFGGGTPSLMKPETVASILDSIGTLWTVNEDAEITLEANPTSVEAANFAGYHDVGVNRLSIGVQSLNDDELKFLGRNHTASEALDAVDIAMSVFEHVSFDLIYARPHQTVDVWRRELTQALSVPVEHISLYQLTIEPETKFAQLYGKGVFQLPEESTARALYDATGEICAEHGFDRYEISNYAKPNAASKHNLVYWKYHDFVGAGPGAHSRFMQEGQRRALECEKHPEAWAKLVTSQGHGFTTSYNLHKTEAGDEFLLMGLRLLEGVDLARYEQISGRQANKQALATLTQDGFINDLGGTQIAASEEGLAVLDTLIAKITA